MGITLFSILKRCIRRIAKSAICATRPYFGESGNSFLQGCAASLEKAEQPNTETNAEMDAVIACSSFLRGLIEGMNLGVQFAEANAKAPSPQPWCMPNNVTPIQSGLVLVKYVRAHPETAHEKTVFLSLLAFSRSVRLSRQVGRGQDAPRGDL